MARAATEAHTRAEWGIKVASELQDEKERQVHGAKAAQLQVHCTSIRRKKAALECDSRRTCRPPITQKTIKNLLYTLIL